MRPLGLELTPGCAALGAPWSPLRLSPLVWLPPGSYSPSTGAWVNAGSGGNGSQGTSSKRPTMGTLTTGAPALVFDGVDDNVVLPSACRPSSPAYMISLVVQAAAAGSYPYLLGGNPADTGFGLFAFNGNSLTPQPFAIGNANIFCLASGHDLSVGTPYVLTAIYDGAALSYYQGQTLIKTQAGVVASASPASVVLGAQNTGGAYGWNGLIGPVLTVPSVPDAATRTRAIAYLAAMSGGVSV